jgi:hypothetical protein
MIAAFATHMHLLTRYALALTTLLLLAAGGCGRTVSLGDWKQGVERYVEVHGGDPTVLRDVTLAGTRRGFAVISHNHPAESTDARAILLAHREVAGKPRFVYLVGLVRQDRVRDIRLATLAIENGKYRWHMSDSDGEALQTYRQHNERLARQRFSDRAKLPVDYLSFPRVEDRFDLQVESNRLMATHQASGARWELTLPPPRGQTATAASQFQQTPAQH